MGDPWLVVIPADKFLRGREDRTPVAQFAPAELYAKDRPFFRIDAGELQQLT